MKNIVSIVLALFCANSVCAADMDVPVSINPELAAHTALFAKKVYKIGDNVYSAVGYGLANIIMVEGSDGIVIVDTGCGMDQATEVLAEFRKITTKPIKYIVYTHHHADHVGGTRAFASPADVASGKVTIISHDSLPAEFAQENGVIGEVMSIRAGSQYNSFLAMLKPDEVQNMNSGIGPIFSYQKTGFLLPTKMFHDKLDMTLCGIPMQLRYVPSEANSEICIFIPKDKILLSAEVIQDHTFPNLYTLRGANFRDPETWVKSIDFMRTLDADYMVPQHGPPVEGKFEVAKVLEMYRDGIQLVHDQSLRFADDGYAKDELIQKVRLPEVLANYSPWLREFYGSVKHSAPQVYSGYIGWFDGDPVALDPTPRVEYAKRMVALIGGHDRVLSEAKQAYESGDNQFAAELATYLIRMDNEDMDARTIKAAAFRKLGYENINANWRGLYITAANVLEKKIDLNQVVAAERVALSAPSFLSVVPMINQLGILATRLKSEELGDKHLTVVMVLKDRNEKYTTEIRHGILDYRAGAADNPDIVIEGNAVDIGKMVSAAYKPDEVLPNLEITKGTQEDAKKFLSYFSLRLQTAPNIFVR
jgi:alkyl sulfatase BDS1-like metallo-beta-lactamase superfamily hydrolase